jgi:hypothetical protein
MPSVCTVLLGSYYQFRRTRLRIVSLDSSGLYLFIVALDLILIYKQPTMNLAQLEFSIQGRTSTSLWLVLCVGTAFAGHMGAWFDSRAERALRRPDEAAGGREWRSAAKLANYASQVTSAAWRTCHTVLQSVVTVVHLLLILTIVGFAH